MLKDRENLIQLLTSGNSENIDLALQLEQGTGIDLTDFWQTIEATFKLWDEAPSELKDKKDRNRADWKHLLLKDKIFINDVHEGDDPNTEILPEGVTFLRHITLLIIRIRKLKTLPKTIERLEKLSALWFMSTKSFETLPTEIGHLSQLENLSFIRGRINTLPESICQLHQLKTLGLDVIDHLPSFISKLQSLRSLTLSHEKTNGHFLSYIYPLFRLQRLHANHCNISMIHDDIKQMRHLKYLNLNNNQLTTLPDALTELKKLKEIRLEHNPIAQKELNRLRELLPRCSIIT